MALLDYLKQNNHDGIILVEIEGEQLTYQTGSVQATFYMSDKPYFTESSDSIGAIPFTPCIESDLRYGSTVSNIFGTRASRNYGTISLSTPEVFAVTTVSGTPQYGVKDVRSSISNDAIDVASTVTVKLAGPRSLFTYAEAITLFTAKVDNVSYSSGGGVSISISSIIDSVYDKSLSTCSGTYGTVLNMKPELVDFATLKYSVNDGEIEAINGVFDRAVALTLTTDYTVDLSAGTITLVNTPDDLTVDVSGSKESGVFARTTQEVVDRIIDQVSLNITTSSDWDVDTDDIGYIVENPGDITLDVVLDELAAGHLGFWFVNRSNEITMLKWDSSGINSYTYDETQVMDYSWEYNSETYRSTSASTYDRNWHSGGSPAAGADPTRADFHTSEFGGIKVSAVSDGVNNSSTIEAPTVHTYFAQFSGSPAKHYVVAPFRSRVYEVEVPAYDILDIGDSVTFPTDEGDVTGLVIGITTTLGKGYPTNKLKVLP